MWQQLCIILLAMTMVGFNNSDVPRLCEAIKLAEHSKTHPYGIMRSYCTANSYRQCRKGCLQTVTKSFARYSVQNRERDFIVYLSRTYAPLGAKNDPNSLNQYWVKNVKWFLERG